MLHFIVRFIGKLLCIHCVFCSCTPDDLPPADFVRYIRDPNNGFVERQKQTDIFIEAFYQPPEYIALMQIPPEDLSEFRLKKEIEKNSTFYQFMLSLGSASATPIDEILSKASNGEDGFEAKKLRMQYRLQNGFALITGKDSLPCVFYHVQPSGKIDNAYHFILAFEADSSMVIANRSENLTLVYKDSIWYHKRFDFVFDKNKISQSPRLKF